MLAAGRNVLNNLKHSSLMLYMSEVFKKKHGFFSPSIILPKQPEEVLRVIHLPLHHRSLTSPGVIGSSHGSPPHHPRFAPPLSRCCRNSVQSKSCSESPRPFRGGNRESPLGTGESPFWQFLKNPNSQSNPWGRKDIFTYRFTIRINQM